MGADERSDDRKGEVRSTLPDEDLSESVAYYFLEPDKLRNGVGGKPGEIGNPCRKRFDARREVRQELEAEAILTAPALPPGKANVNSM